MGLFVSFTLIMSMLFIGEWASTKTKAVVPSLFMTAVLFVLGFWTFFPKDMVEQVGFGMTFAKICVPLTLVHLGTKMDLRQLVDQWKAIVIALLGVCGTIALCLTIGTMIFDFRTVIASVPPLVGGLVAALLMSDNLKAMNLDTLAALPIYMLMFHGLLGYPITAMLLKKEGKRLKAEFKTKQAQQQTIEIDAMPLEKVKWIDTLPKQYRTPAFALARVGLVIVLANGLSILLQHAVNANILCLLLGIVFSQFGLLETNVLQKAGVFNWLIYGLTAYIFSQLSTTTPSTLFHFIPQIFTLMILAILGMWIMTRLIHKFFGYSKEMALATALTALFGFPADYILTNDVIKEVAETKEETEYLTAHLMPKMLVAGFATVSITSIVIASIFIKLL